MLLLDEPTAGMNPQESARFNDFVHRVRDERDMSVLLIEHDMSVIMRVSERITVLDRGVMIAEGSPDDIRNNQRVIEAYLGKTGPGRQAAQMTGTETDGDGSAAARASRSSSSRTCTSSYGNIAAVKGLDARRSTRARSSP